MIQIPECVTRGAALLDEHMIQWAKKISIVGLNSHSRKMDIIGQLAGEADYDERASRIGLSDLSSRAEHGLHEPGPKHLPLVLVRSYYQSLDWWWIAAIENRLSVKERLSSSLATRVRFGSSLLSRTRDWWWMHIENETLDMGSSHHCVLGKIYGHLWEGTRALNVSGDEIYAHGYNVAESGDYETLTRLWREEIVHLEKN